MVYRGSYALVLALHLLTAVFVVGPLAVAAVLSPRHVRARAADALRSDLRTTRVYSLASVLVVLLGTGLVALSGEGTPQWSMGDLWVSASYALWLVAVVLALLVVVPAQTRALEEIEAGRDASVLAGRIGAAAGVAMLCWSVIIVLMVYKPGT